MIQCGPIIKIIREKHGFPAKDIYDGILSKANYYRFEKGESETNSTNLIEMLFRLGVDISEFGSLYRQKFTEDFGVKDVYNSFLNAYNLKDFRSLKKYSLTMKKAYEESNFLDFLHNSMIFDIWADYFEHGELIETKKELETLLEYVKKAETWFDYDIQLYSAILPVLNWEDIKTTIPYVINRSFLPRTINDREEVSQPSLVLAAIESVLKERNYEYFAYLLPILEQTRPTEKEVNAFYALKVFKLLRQFVDGTNDNGLTQAETHLDCLAYLGATEIHDRLRKDLAILIPMVIQTKKEKTANSI